MPKTPAEPARQLHRKAEKALRAREGEPARVLLAGATPQTLHDLQVYQIELEMQNEELRRTQTELTAAQSRYFELYDLAPTGYLTLDREGLILEANLTAATILGTTRAFLLRSLLSKFVYPEDRDNYALHLQRLAQSGKGQDWDVRLLRAGGAIIWTHLRSTPAHDEQVWITFNDITERKTAEAEILRLNNTLERRVAERTLELETTINELNAFSYSVSHDLRAPLRAVDGFSRILLNEYAPRLDDEGRRICTVIGDSARRMGQLIDALLAFSRLGHTEIHHAPVDMVALAREAFLEATPPQEREHIEFRLAPLPRAIGDPALLRQVWLNLLGNAVKFSTHAEQPVIAVEATEQGGEIVYAVSDNGAGFDMRYADKLFGVFQRLHGEKEFPGTGLGLALVQRIVQRHGGRIWGESEPGKGATFSFTISQRGEGVPGRERHSPSP